MSKAVGRLSPPMYPDSVVERLEVNKSIDAALRKNLVHIHAPAGFGKTIAMCMWLWRSSLPAAWVFWKKARQKDLQYTTVLLGGKDSSLRSE